MGLEVSREEDDDQPHGLPTYYLSEEMQRLNDEAKVQLLNSGEFGGVPTNPPRNAFNLLQERQQTGSFSRRDRIELLEHRIPNSKPISVDRYGARAYCGQYSQDGMLFFSACQDWRIRLYDTSTPLRPRKIKTIKARPGRWTLTDCQLTADKRFLIYSSITPHVYLTNLTGVLHDDSAPVHQEKLDFSQDVGEDFEDSDSENFFGIWSIRFSGDDREVVAGASDNALYVYDIETKRVTFRAQTHRNHVNAVAFANEKNSNLVCSGGDDAMIYVWDRRTFSSSNKPVGMLVGHSEGLTYISSKGDGIYLLSNSKDQTMKLWDLRSSLVPYNKNYRVRLRHMWDYRMTLYPGDPGAKKRDDDRSVLTMCGHYCLQTLIRCGFSAEAQTGQRYLYCGSFDGRVYIYDLAGRIVQTLGDGYSVVRDVSWHPDVPAIMSTAWDGTINLFTYEDAMQVEEDDQQSSFSSNP